MPYSKLRLAKFMEAKGIKWRHKTSWLIQLNKARIHVIPTLDFSDASMLVIRKTAPYIYQYFQAHMTSSKNIPNI